MKNIRTSLRTPLLLGLFSATAWMALAPATAQAHVRWSVNIGVGGYYPAPRVYYPAPRVYYPAPAVVYRPAPVYVPAYVEPVYQEPVVVYDRPVRHVAPPHYYAPVPVAPSGYGYRRSYREYRDYSR
jgi:hypothetical protein